MNRGVQSKPGAEQTLHHVLIGKITSKQKAVRCKTSKRKTSKEARTNPLQSV